MSKYRRGQSIRVKSIKRLFRAVKKIIIISLLAASVFGICIGRKEIQN